MSQDQTWSGDLGQQFGLLVDGVRALAAALGHFALRGQYPIHRADRAQVGAFIQQAGKDLGGRLIGEAGTAQMVQDLSPLTAPARRAATEGAALLRVAGP